MLPALTSASQRGARCLASCSSQFKSLKTATELVLDVGFNLGSFKTHFYKQKSRREVSDPKGLSFPFLLFGSSRQNDTRPVVLMVCVTRTLHMKNFLLQAEHLYYYQTQELLLHLSCPQEMGRNSLKAPCYFCSCLGFSYADTDHQCTASKY